VTVPVTVLVTMKVRVTIPMNPRERREQLLAKADSLISEMRKITGPINLLVSELVEEADSLLPKIVNNQSLKHNSALAKTRVVHCSICGGEGHRMQTCTKGRNQ